MYDQSEWCHYTRDTVKMSEEFQAVMKEAGYPTLKFTGVDLSFFEGNAVFTVAFSAPHYQYGDEKK